MSGTNQTFSFTGSIISYTVPTTGLYDIVATGASGANSDAAPTDGIGGLGAVISGEVQLTAGEVLEIAVGGAGATGSGLGAAGGGGGSFVVEQAGSTLMPLVIAGGGGGGSHEVGLNGGDGGGIAANGGAGGSGGVGDTEIYGVGSSGGGGGGGFQGNGAVGGTGSATIDDTTYTNAGGAGGSSFVNGAAGGTSLYGGNGGFGGGGGAGGVDGGGGGGGGYTGGNGGQFLILGPNYGGAGGTSFDSGTNQQAGVATTKGNGSVSITLTSIAVASTIAGTTANQPTTDATPISPFANVTITDPSAGGTETVTVTPSSTANGMLSSSNGGSVGSNGVYTVTGSASAVTAALDKLVFTPTQHEVTPGQTVVTSFSISDTNSANLTTADTTSSVVATAVNDAPVISGTKAGQAVADNATIKPFSNVAVTDPDVGVQDSLTITLTGAGGATDANGSLDGSGLTRSGTGTYSLAAASPAALTAELDALTFTPTLHQTGPGQSVTTGFTLTASQTAGGSTASSTDSTTSVVATAIDTPPTLAKSTLTYTVGEGRTLQNLYSQILANASDADPGDQAQLTISSIGQPSMGFVSLDTANRLLTFTADGYNAKAPTSSFTYTVSDPHGGTVTGTVDVTVTGANETTQVGAPGADTLTASQAGTRLIGGNGDDTLNANAASTLVFGGSGNDTVNVNAAKAIVYGGTGTNTINLGNTAQDSIVLQQGGTDLISGFNLHNGDVLDLTQVLAEAQKSFSAKDFQVTASGNNATLSYIGSPSFTGGAALATLMGVGANVTLQTLLNDNVLKVG